MAYRDDEVAGLDRRVTILTTVVANLEDKVGKTRLRDRLWWAADATRFLFGLATVPGACALLVYVMSAIGVNEDLSEAECASRCHALGLGRSSTIARHDGMGCDDTHATRCLCGNGDAAAARLVDADGRVMEPSSKAADTP